MGKRGNNEGSVYERSDGKWVGAVTLGYNSNGNPRRKVVYGKTRAEASRKLAELLDKSHKGLLAEPSSITVAEFAKDWIERQTIGKAENTRRNYEMDLGAATKHIGTMRLQAVKPAHIRAMLDKLATEGYRPQQTKKEKEEGKQRPPKPYSPRNQKMALQRLSAMFKDAIGQELIYRNPCEAIKVKVPPSEPVGRTLEAWEITKLLPIFEAHPTMGLFFRLLLDTGLRKGEALALTWADLDLDQTPAWLRVNKQWIRKAKKGFLSNRLKTKRSTRRVPIPPEVAQALRVFRASSIETYGPGVARAYVFGSPETGTPYDPGAPNHVLTRICKREGLAHIRVHDLRHTFGSVLLSQGVPLEVVSERLGHANPTITLAVYRHLMEHERSDYVIGASQVAAPTQKPATAPPN